MILTIDEPFVDYRIIDCQDLITTHKLQQDGYIQLNSSNPELRRQLEGKKYSRTSLGGTNLVTAHLLAKQKVPVAFVGSVGDDSNGRYIIDQLK